MPGARALALLGLLVAGCGRGRPEPPPALPAVAGIASVLRLASEGGTAIAYQSDSLAPTGWQSERALPGLQEILGYDPDEQVVFGVDLKGRLVGLDLRTGSARTFAAGVQRATVGPDGAAYAIDSAGRLLRIARQATTVFTTRYTEPPAALFGALNGQVVAVRAGGRPEAQLLSEDRVGPTAPIGAGPVAATFWGDLVATGYEGGVHLLRTSDGSSVHELGRGSPDRLVFSPSGHRLYALEGDRIRIFDRYSGNRIGAVELPAEGRDLRMDASGRWLLVRHAAADTAWVVDLASAALVAPIETEWRADLPLVSGAAGLLTAAAGDVVAWNLGQSPPQPTARALGGAADLWMSVPWVPPARQADARAAAESARQAQDEALLPQTDAPLAGAIWVQVSSSQNPEWADDLARQIADAGFPTAVWKPTTPEDGYRVVIGPFPSRDEAEEAGRRLGRPFFVVSGAPKVP